MVEYLELSMQELLLDENNPRLGSVANQAEALEEIIRLDEGHFRTMMLSIKENGLDPGDSLYVIAEEGSEDYIVLEGNRRLSAMMVLSNPDVLDGTNSSASIKKSLTRAAKNFDHGIIDPIRCVQFPDRAEANDWIFRRHTGAADGEGRITWGPLEVQRFSKDHSVLDVIDFVGRNANYTDEEWASTKTVIESKRSSTLSRILESKSGRKHIGLSIVKSADGKVPMLDSQPVWALKVLKRIIEDVRDGVIGSRDINSASEIGAYLTNLPKELQPSKKTKGKLTPLKDISLKSATTTKAAGAAGGKSKVKTKAAPRPRKTLAPKRHPFNSPKVEKGKLLLLEASKIDANTLTISSSFVLRAFLELAIHQYMDDNGIPLREKDKKGDMKELSLSQCADKVLKDITKTKAATNADLRSFKSKLITKTSDTSIQSLNSFIHNKYAVPTPDALRAGWDSCVPVFIAAFGKV